MYPNRLTAFVVVPAALAPATWSTQLYQLAMERVRASLRPSLYEAGLDPLWN
jgi:hypothetical protein